VVVVTLYKGPQVVVVTLSKGAYVVVITSCKGPLVVVITSYKGPMMVGSYVVKGDRSQAVNYRPVSLTSICYKTMEHIVSRHIIEHLENHQIL
jgi:hypothetical protein